MKKIVVLFTCLLSAIAFAQKPIFTTAKVKAATVYFNAAELSQTTTVSLPSGTSEIVIKNVADYLNENTVQIGSPSSVTILSVQFTNNYMSEYEIDENNPVIKKVRDSITLVEKEITRLQIERISTAKTVELLDKNQQVSGGNSGLNITDLMKMVEYYKSKRTELNNDITLLQEKETQWNERLAKLNAKLEINTKNEEKTSKGKLVLQVMNEIAGNVNLDINYITNMASWSAFYDLRAENITTPINMMYKAQVIQNSGIDWKKVKLTLSSGTPNQNNKSPELNAWFLKYVDPIKNRYGYIDDEANDYYYYRDGDYKSTRFDTLANGKIIARSLQGQAPGLNIDSAEGAPGSGKFDGYIRGASSINGNSEPLIVINGVPSSSSNFKKLRQEAIKSVEVIRDASATSIYGNRGSNGVILVTTKNMDDYTSISENELNVSFEIDIPYDILSNGKKHSVALKEIKLPATYTYYAAPKVDKEAYLLAKIDDYSKFNLLPGDANIIFEGLYVGKTFINPNETSDTLSLSMGRDKKISIKREKVVDKSGVKFLSSFKEQTFTYDILIRNNKKETVDMILKEQYPLSTEKDIKIELLESNQAKINEETGILTWNIKLAANETKKFRISYKVRYPKDKNIGNL